MRLDIVANLSMGRYALKVVEDGVAPVKSLCSICMSVDFSTWRQRPKQQKRDAALMITECTSRKDTSSGASHPVKGR